MSGKFKTYINNVVTLGHPPGPDSLHTVAANATVTLDGKAAKMADLQPDDDVDVSGDPATSVTATRHHHHNVPSPTNAPPNDPYVAPMSNAPDAPYVAPPTGPFTKKNFPQ